ncbi:MAG: nuclease-related domain-containing protein [Alphaproteobacteria bacterium]|nr:nuclease-related domain-containing protein [Alphaproteobacteria bacterium]
MVYKQVNTMTYVTIVIIVVMAVVIYFCLINFRQHRAISFQNQGEALVAETLRISFPGKDFHILNHITLEYPGGTTQIDHILLTCFGIFVIETKNYSGWIFANSDHDHWTQVIYRSKFKFQNPLRQNLVHLRAVKKLLDFLPAETIESAVLFVGNAKFKTDIPHGVFTLQEFITYVASHSKEKLSRNRLQFCIGRIESERLAITTETDIQHIENLYRRYGKQILE